MQFTYNISQSAAGEMKGGETLCLPSGTFWFTSRKWLMVNVILYIFYHNKKKGGAIIFLYRHNLGQTMANARSNEQKEKEGRLAPSSVVNMPGMALCVKANILASSSISLLPP